jgi:hypothetical protein
MRSASSVSRNVNVWLLGPYASTLIFSGGIIPYCDYLSSRLFALAAHTTDTKQHSRIL